MYNNLSEAAVDCGVHADGRSDEEAIRRGVANEMADRGLGWLGVDIELHDDAILILTDGELHELKYPFDEDDYNQRMDDIEDVHR